MKVFIITKLDDEELERETLDNPIPQVIEEKAKEVAAYNERQSSWAKRGLINKPKVKLLIT